MLGFEPDGKSVENNFIINSTSLVLFQKVIAPYVTSPEDSDVIKMLKAAGVVHRNRRTEGDFGPCGV